MFKYFFVIALLFSQNIWANNEDITLAIHRQYVTPRALGMGFAITSIVDDYSALFYNPAALSRLKEGEINANIQAALSDDYMDFIDDLDQANNVGTADSTARQQAIINVINKYTGEHFHARANLGLIWARPNWGIAFIPLDLSIEMGIHKSLGPALSTEVYQDSTIAYGFSMPVPKAKNLTMGFTIKSIYRGYIGKDLLAIDLVDNDVIDDEDFKEGLTIDADIGLLYEPDWWKSRGYVPKTYSMVIRNVLDYGFTENFELLNDNSTEPPKLQRTIDLGTAWQLPKFWVFDPKVSFEIHDILHDYFSIKKGSHIGAELAWKAASWLEGAYRIGLNQGYYTAGISLQLSAFKLDVATYGEEVGTSDAEIEDRRYVLNMSLDF